jgi:hypothetical protein
MFRRLQESNEQEKLLAAVYCFSNGGRSRSVIRKCSYEYSADTRWSLATFAWLVELAFPPNVSPPLEFASAILINAVVWYLIRKMLLLDSTAPLDTP